MFATELHCGAWWMLAAATCIPVGAVTLRAKVAAWSVNSCRIALMR